MRFAALRARWYKGYLSGGSLMMAGDNAEHAITYWVMWQTFHSPLLAGFAVISHWLPHLFFSVFFIFIALAEGLTALGLPRWLSYLIVWGLLVIIAAGLLSSAVHHAAEAGMFTGLSDQALDLSAVIVPSSDSVTTGLITGLLGIYPFPTDAEVLVWLLYAVPMLAFVLWPSALPRRRLDTA